MGLMDKVKHLLFDEDVVEVPVKSDELPKREVAVKEEFPSRGSFINHHEEEENPIKEVVVPKEEEEEKTEEIRKFNFIEDDDFDFMPKKREEFKSEVKKSRFDEEIKTLEKNNNVGLQTNKDYKKLIEDHDQQTKKPFKVTPVISSVYGYIEFDDSRLNKNTSAIEESKPVKRNFGPVSYNEQPINIEEEKVEVKEIEEDNIINTELDEIKTSGIEQEYLGNNNIEEAFVTTSELETINDEDNMYRNVDYTPQTIEESEEEKEENERLEDTIETDLFNLIDSMYKDEEETEIESGE